MIIGGAAAAVIYGLFDPAKYAFFPKCPFVMLTGGLRCPGCGSQRAIHALLHLDIKDAFLCNPMVIIKDTHPGFYKKMNSSLLVKLLLILIIFWWIFRNIAGI